MAHDLRDRVLAAVRKGLAGPLNKPTTEKSRLRGYSIDFSTKNEVTNRTACNRTFPREISAVTALPPVSTNRDIQPETVCMQCGAGDDLWHLDTSTGPVVVHAECAEFLPRPNPAEPTAGYQGVTGEPDGSSVEVTIIELPRARRYRRVYGILQTKCPDGVDAFRWETCLKDGSRFLAKWGLEAERLGWDSRDLFGLIPIPDRPHPSFNRMSRLDNMGLCWVLMGRRVTALSESTAEIENAATGSRTVFRKRHNE